jgi:hypothetical protein
VYNTETCVSCCGTCNVCKYRFTVREFLDGCLSVARFSCDDRHHVSGEPAKREDED